LGSGPEVEVDSRLGSARLARAGGQPAEVPLVVGGAEGEPVDVVDVRGVEPQPVPVVGVVEPVGDLPELGLVPAEEPGVLGEAGGVSHSRPDTSDSVLEVGV